MAAPAPVRSQFSAATGVRAAQIASSTAARVSGTCPVPADSSVTARRRRLHRAQRCFSNILSSVPQSAHMLVTGSPAQLAQVSAAGPGGLTGRRIWPQRAQAAVARGAHCLQTGWAVPASAQGRTRPHALQAAAGSR